MRANAVRGPHLVKVPQRGRTFERKWKNCDRDSWGGGGGGGSRSR